MRVPLLAADAHFLKKEKGVKRKLKVSRKTALTVAAALMAGVLMGTAVAMFLMSRTIQNSIYIMPAGQFEVYADMSCTQVLTELYWGEIPTRPNNVERSFYIKQLSGDEMKLTWNGSETLPSGMYIDNVAYRGTGESSWTTWEENSFIHTYAGLVIEVSVHVHINEDCPPGNFTFELRFYGYSEVD